MHGQIRPVNPADAAQAALVVRPSILALCQADHQHDPATLRWLGNKQPSYLESWVRDTDNFTVVGALQGSLCGIGLVHSSGEIRLRHLAPEAQRRGLGRAIHRSLEEHAVASGHSRLHLDSARDARAFHESLGYTTTGPARNPHGKLWGYPYAKPLRSRLTGDPEPR